MKSPRERALAHIKTLAAASVLVGCHEAGYGVVDPMPTPACFENPKPTVTAKVLETKEDGARLVEVVVKFQQADAKVGDIQAEALGEHDSKLEVTEQTVNANDFRAVINVRKGIVLITLYAKVSCAGGSGFQVYLDVDGANVVVKSVR